MEANEFKCEECLGIFEHDPDWTEEDKLTEVNENFPELPQEERASVCDDCYKEIMGRAKKRNLI